MSLFLSLDSIIVKYGNVTAVNNVSFGVEEGKILCLLGPSGCGKTTLLRTISGFVRPTSGQVFVKGQDYTNSPVHKRNMGLVFQNYALFPHLKVFDNMAYGLKMRKKDKQTIANTVMTMLETVDLATFADRYPSELSGGQQQRVALARALAIQPDVLLLDEPLSNLDAQLRLKMRSEIRRIQRKFNVTTVFVTHDQSECFAISDDVIILNDGNIMQQADPNEILEKPANEFVARFIGYENIVQVNGRHLAFRAEDAVQEVEGNGLKLSGKVVLSTREGRKFTTVLQTGLGDVRVLTDEFHPEGKEDVTAFVPQRNLVELNQ